MPGTVARCGGSRAVDLIGLPRYVDIDLCEEKELARNRSWGSRISFSGFFERLGRSRIGWVESLDHELCGGDIESRAERGDHVQEPELAAAVHDVQGNKYPVGRIGCFLARLGYSRVAARFIGELRQSGIRAGEDLMIEAPQQVGSSTPRD